MIEKIEDLRAKKEGRITPKAMITNLLQAIEIGEIKGVVFVAKTQDDDIETGWSDVQTTEAIGLLECAKAEILQAMFNPE
ncbi:hypothetical protein [uncultured Brevibacillus sp.]|uniref:hypothetical protein n=1 Tax=uncultured Brevibacillus sp. TaxID=169970 RepID=UPI00259A949E|nr:hypothetical protein [uncultured Brevibacillus sp.]